MHSFQNMYGMLYAKVDRLAGKIDFVQKQPLKRPFWERIALFSLWEELEAKLLRRGQLLGYPSKLWDITRRRDSATLVNSDFKGPKSRLHS